MLQVVTNFQIMQVTPFGTTTRNQVINFDFAAEIEVFSSWKNLTDTAVVKFPKNIYVLNATTGGVMSLEKQNITQADSNPLILRGDKITITVGYISDSDGKKTMNTIFTGYVAEVNNRMPIELRCEDNMFALKQLAATPKTYNSPCDTVGTVLQEQVGKIFTIDDYGQNIPVGNLTVNNGSVVQLIEKLCNDYKLECYFIGNTLRIGTIVYYYDDLYEAGGTGNPWIMDFQYNVISDNLVYKRADTINLAVRAYSYNNVASGGINKNRRIDVCVGQPGGEEQTIYYPAINSEKNLKALAQGRLNRINVDGWSGKLTTFGLPRIQHGDAVQLVDAVIPERNGNYLVKSVKTTMSINGGLRQEIELDMQVAGLPDDIILKGL